MIFFAVLFNSKEHFHGKHSCDLRDFENLVDKLLKLIAKILGSPFVAIVTVLAWEDRHVVIGLEMEVGILNNLEDSHKVLILLIRDNFSHW